MNKYFDNSATSFPKPKELEQAAVNYLRRGGNYGRASYPRALENVRIVEQCRDFLGDMFGVDGENIIFTKNATEGSNLVVNSLNLNGKAVLTSPMEHNAIMRPLKACGAIVTECEAGCDGLIDMVKFKDIEFEKFDLLCVNHVSNVNGVVQPISEIASIVDNRCPLLIDASQSAGAIEFNFCGDFVVFTGHKSLYGPPGIGGVYAKNPKNLLPLIFGGTGSNSDSYDMPNFTPDKFEAGTPNILAIEMLLAAIKNHPDSLHKRDDFLSLLDNIRDMKNVELFAANDSRNQAELFSIRFKNIGIAAAADKLLQDHGIELRRGLHCAPLAHKSLCTFPSGTLRFSLSAYHTKEELCYLAKAIETVGNS